MENTHTSLVPRDAATAAVLRRAGLGLGGLGRLLGGLHRGLTILACVSHVSITAAQTSGSVGDRRAVERLGESVVVSSLD